MLCRAKYAEAGVGHSQSLEHVAQLSDIVYFFHRDTYPRSRHRRVPTCFSSRSCRFNLDTELEKLAMKPLRCIERVHQRSVRAKVGNQTPTFEFDNNDWIARGLYTVNSGWCVPKLERWLI